jgi:hypothetical protein
LAESITSVFGFDFDHSFGFFSKLTGHIYQSPIRYELFADTDGGSSSRRVDRTTVKQAFPRIGSKMLFLFDYGDEWMFKVEVVRFGAKGPKVGYPRTISTVGMAPQQYPDFEDDD